MKRLGAVLLLLACARPPPAKSEARPDLKLSNARVRSWNAKGLELDARAPELLVSRSDKSLDARDADLKLLRAGAEVKAKVLAGDLGGSHFVAPRGAALETNGGLEGTAPEAEYHRADGGVFEGHHGVALAKPDAGFSLTADGFRFESKTKHADFEHVKTVAGGTP